jgi:hypothetical protein
MAPVQNLAAIADVSQSVLGTDEMFSIFSTGQQQHSTFHLLLPLPIAALCSNVGKI